MPLLNGGGLGEVLVGAGVRTRTVMSLHHASASDRRFIDLLGLSYAY